MADKARKAYRDEQVLKALSEKVEPRVREEVYPSYVPREVSGAEKPVVKKYSRKDK